MKPETAQTLLAAARQIEAVSKRLDRSVESCSQCGTTHHRDKDEWQAALELDAMVRKLRKLARTETRLPE